jgi:hypothetical protein
MKQYMLSVQIVDDGTPPPSPEEAQQVYERVDALNADIQAAGAWVFAGGLHPPNTATVVRVRDGDVLMTDGPFAEGKEYIGGFWVIKAEDLDAALAWAARATQACAAPIEVRPLQEETED